MLPARAGQDPQAQNGVCACRRTGYRSPGGRVLDGPGRAGTRGSGHGRLIFFLRYRLQSIPKFLKLRSSSPFTAQRSLVSSTLSRATKTATRLQITSVVPPAPRRTSEPSVTPPRCAPGGGLEAAEPVGVGDPGLQAGWQGPGRGWEESAPGSPAEGPRRLLRSMAAPPATGSNEVIMLLRSRPPAGTCLVSGGPTPSPGTSWLECRPGLARASPALSGGPREPSPGPVKSTARTHPPRTRGRRPPHVPTPWWGHRHWLTPPKPPSQATDPRRTPFT